MGSDSRERAAEIEFARIKRTDLADLASLISGMGDHSGALWLRDKSAAYYDWMYFQNPAGPAIVWAARHGDRVVSTFALAPKRLKVGERHLLVGKTMDMFTAPQYQGMGLIKRCAERVFEDARAAGIDGCYVTPSPNSYPIFKGKWGFREDFGLLYRVRVLRPRELLPVVLSSGRRTAGRLAASATMATRQRPSRLPQGWSAGEVTSFGPTADELWARVAADFRVAVIRDTEYLNWRYVQNPDRYILLELLNHGALQGLLVLKETRRKGLPVGEIVDFVCPSGDSRVLRLLIRVGVDRLREGGCVMVESWAIRGSWVDHQLLRAGLVIPRAAVPFLISPAHGYEDVYDGSSWLLTQGDGNDV